MGKVILIFSQLYSKPLLQFNIYSPRNCIGMRFALLESKLALVEILLKYRFVTSPRTKIPLEFYPTGRPLLGPKMILLAVERRNLETDE